MKVTALPTVVRRAPQGRGAVLLTRQRDPDVLLPWRVILVDGGGHLISGAAFSTAAAAERAFDELGRTAQGAVMGGRAATDADGAQRRHDV